MDKGKCDQSNKNDFIDLLEKEAPRCVAALTLNLLELISTNSFVLRALIWSQCGSKGGGQGLGSLPP